MQRQQQLRFGKPALQSQHQIDAHMQIVVQMNDLETTLGQGLMQLAPTTEVDGCVVKKGIGRPLDQPFIWAQSHDFRTSGQLIR